MAEDTPADGSEVIGIAEEMVAGEWLQRDGQPYSTTGEVYDTYRELCRHLGMNNLTQRRITDLISELDMLGIINARLKSFGRGGRTREISLAVSLYETADVLRQDEMLRDLIDSRPYQMKLL